MSITKQFLKIVGTKWKLFKPKSIVNEYGEVIEEKYEYEKDIYGHLYSRREFIEPILLTQLRTDIYPTADIQFFTFEKLNYRDRIQQNEETYEIIGIREVSFSRFKFGYEYRVRKL